MAMDHGSGFDSLRIDAGVGLAERGRVRTRFVVEKWDLDQAAFTRRKLDLPAEPDWLHFLLAKVKPFEVYGKEDANIILDAGWVLIMNGFAGSGITKFSSTVGRIGGGTSGAATAYTQTDLQAATGATTRQWELVSSAPSVGGSHTAGLVFAATFPTTDGNFTWAEFGVDQGTAGGTGASVATMLNRGLATPGTKTASQIWNATVTITWA